MYVQSQSLPPLDFQESRASSGRLPESGSSENKTRRTIPGGGSGRRRSSNGDNKADNQTDTSNGNCNINGSDGGNISTFPEAGPLSSAPQRDEMRLSPAMSSLGSQPRGVDGGGEGGGVGDEREVTDVDRSPVATAASMRGVGGDGGGIYNRAHASDASDVPSGVDGCAADAQLDRPLRERTESDVIETMDKMRRSIERGSSANDANGVNGHGSGEQKVRACPVLSALKSRNIHQGFIRFP